MSTASPAKTAAPRRIGLLEFIRRAQRNQLELLGPELFTRDLSHTRIFFLHSFLVNKPEYIEQVLLTNQQNYNKGQFVQRLLGPRAGAQCTAPL
jgi:hypothetical protein